MNYVTDLEEVFEAVDDFVSAVSIFPPFTQEDGLLMEEHLTLHWLEAQVFQFTLVLCRHLKAPLHNQLSLLREMALVKKKSNKSKICNVAASASKQAIRF